MITDSKDAKNISQAIKVDNMAGETLLMTTRAEGNTLVSEVQAQNMGTMLSTIDDLIACQITAEEMIG